MDFRDRQLQEDQVNTFEILSFAMSFTNSIKRLRLLTILSRRVNNYIVFLSLGSISVVIDLSIIDEELVNSWSI